MTDYKWESQDRATAVSENAIRDDNAQERLAPAVTRHVLHAENGDLQYTAVAGYLDLTEENIGGSLAQEPSVKARVFITQYVGDADTDDHGNNPRPVIFVFNGGPGTSSAWLHLGLFGPRIVDVLQSDGVTACPPPYHLRENPQSPLACADVVVIDAISTGYSRVVPGEDANQYHHADVDVEAMTNIIRLWITRNERWNSPLYIAGESYGVLRGSRVAARLAVRYGVYLSGLVLISSPITFGRMGFGPGSFLGAHAFFPTYAAVAHYHGNHPELSMKEVLSEAEEFADTKLLWALNQGHRLDTSTRATIVARYADLTGLSRDVVEQANLSVTPQQFRTELLRSRGVVLGEYDARFTGWNEDQLSRVPEADFTDQAVRGAFAAGINSYLRQDLEYKNDLNYELDTTRVRPWRTPSDFHRNPFHVIGALAEAMRVNRSLRVLYQVGHYDLCTPFYGAVSDVALLPIPEELRGNITVHEFDSGHMIYLDEESRIIQSRQIRDFILLRK